jgi:hypothetical protein
MNFEHISKHLRLYARSMGLIAEIRLSAQLRKSLLGIFAAGMAVFGLAMINFGLYHALTAIWGEIWTPLAIGCGDLAVAGLAVWLASRMRYGRELQLAEELRDSVGAEIAADLQSLRNLPLMTNLIGPLEGNAVRLLVPVLGTIISALRSHKKA